jgi:hypothetical protein
MKIQVRSLAPVLVSLLFVTAGAHRYQQAADWFRRQRTPITKKPVPTAKRKGHAPRVRRPNRTR